MRIAFNPDEDPQGILETVGGTLRQISAPEDTRSIFLLGITSPLAAVRNFTDEDVAIIAPFDALALYFYQETFDVEHFHELSTLQKLFVEGVQDQLARNVIYVGCPVDTKQLLWLDVPKRFPEETPGADTWYAVKESEDVKKTITDAIAEGVADIASEEPHQEREP